MIYFLLRINVKIKLHRLRYAFVVNYPSALSRRFLKSAFIRRLRERRVNDCGVFRVQRRARQTGTRHRPVNHSPASRHRDLATRSATHSITRRRRRSSSQPIAASRCSAAIAAVAVAVLLPADGAYAFVARRRSSQRLLERPRR